MRKGTKNAMGKGKSNAKKFEQQKLNKLRR